MDLGVQVLRKRFARAFQPVPTPVAVLIAVPVLLFPILRGDDEVVNNSGHFCLLDMGQIFGIHTHPPREIRPKASSWRHPV